MGRGLVAVCAWCLVGALWSAEPARPAEATPAEAPGASELADAVLVLPTVTVRPGRVRPPPDFAWLSERGRLSLALKDAPAFRLGNFFGLNAAVALELQAEERQAQARAALTETVERATLVDNAENRRIRRLLKAATQRPDDYWATGSGARSGHR